MNTFKRLWVLGDSGSTILDFEDTKVSEFKAVSPAKLVYDLIKKRLDGFLDVSATLLSGVGDSIDEVFFSCGCHSRAPLHGSSLCHARKPSAQTLGIWNGDRQRPTKNQHPHAGTAQPIHSVLNEYRQVSAKVSSLHIGLEDRFSQREIRFTA